MQQRNSKGQFVKNSAPWNKNKKGLQVAWNKGLTKEDKRVRQYSSNNKGQFLAGFSPWNKGIKGTHFSKKTEFTKGQIPWNKGLTKETDERVKRNAESIKATHWTKKPKHERDKIIKKMRIARLNQDFSFQYTSIEKKIFRSLEKNNIIFTPHKSILNLTEVDAFIEPNVCIYCDGDYWHANPNKYDYSKLDDNQKWHVERDKRNNHILKKHGYVVLRFWESEIKKDINSCIEKIQCTINGNKYE